MDVLHVRVWALKIVVLEEDLVLVRTGADKISDFVNLSWSHKFNTSYAIKLFVSTKIIITIVVVLNDNAQ